MNPTAADFLKIAERALEEINQIGNSTASLVARNIAYNALTRINAARQTDSVEQVIADIRNHGTPAAQLWADRLEALGKDK